MNGFLEIVFSGILNNILITVFSCIIPVVAGFVLAYIAKNNSMLSTPIKVLGNVCESLSPIIMIVVLFYCVFAQTHINRIVICIIAFSISFIGYIPSNLKEEYSLSKNVVVNFVGLIAHVFKWSFCTTIIGTTELLRNLQMTVSRTYETGVLWIGLIISFMIVFILNMIKFVLEEKMN